MTAQRQIPDDDAARSGTAIPGGRLQSPSPGSSPSGDSGAAPAALAVRTGSEASTMDLAARIAGILQPGDIVSLDGPLGSGKTCFVRGLGRGLGIDPASVSSPTFILRQEYVGRDGLTLTHIDGYRISGPEELETIGWDELLSSRESIVAVEWPSRLGEVLADRVTVAVTFEHCSATERELTMEVSASCRDRFREVIGDGREGAGE